MRVWISKYALTQGLFEIDAEVCENTNPDMIKDTSDPYWGFYHKGEWHKTREEAVARAEVMRTKKLASLNRQIKKLEDMTF